METKEDTGTDDCKEEGMTVGEELLQELKETKDRKHRQMMKDHLKKLVKQVADLKETKSTVLERLKGSEQELELVTKFTLDEYAKYTKDQHDLDADSYNHFTNRTVDHTKARLRNKLKTVTFSTRY